MKTYDWLDARVRQVAGKRFGVVGRQVALAERPTGRAGTRNLIDVCRDLLSESGEAFGMALAHATSAAANSSGCSKIVR